jgi:ABC-type lipoprotein export system ATPase subunit
MIKTSDVSRTYAADQNRVDALRHVSLEVQAGEFIAITGPSGSGKSTLMHLMGALDRATAGEIWLDGKPLSGLSRRELAAVRSTKIGFVFQMFNLLPSLTVEENVALPALVAGERRSSYDDRLRGLLADVGLASKLSRFPAQLSGGEQQRVAIARALMNNPAVILADEPTGNLDSEAGQQVMSLLGDCHARGNTIVFVTHDPGVARQAKRIVVLRDGRVVDDDEKLASGEHAALPDNV